MGGLEYLGMLANVGACRARGVGERGREQPGVGAAIFGGKRARHDCFAQPGILTVHLLAVQHSQRQTVIPRHIEVGHQRGLFLGVSGQLEVTRLDKLDVVAHQFGHAPPQFVRATRDRQLCRVSTLLAYAAVVDARGLTANRAALEQHHPRAAPGQVQRRGAAGAATALDEDVTGDIHCACASLRMGIGLTGGCARTRPT